MKVKITLGRNASSSTKSDVVAKIVRALGSKATVSGDFITVDSYDEKRVIDILNSKGIDYSRSQM